MCKLKYIIQVLTLTSLFCRPYHTIAGRQRSSLISSFWIQYRFDPEKERLHLLRALKLDMREEVGPYVVVDWGAVTMCIV